MPTSELTKAINGLNTENRNFVEKMIFLLIKEQDAGNSETKTVSTKYYRKPGIMKGKVVMSDDFDAPLDEMKEYM